MRAPVAFLIFNRPETTRRVFAEVARARPKLLLIVADGPRRDLPGEAERCAAAREVVERIDWECEVLKNYAEENMGCRLRVASGLDWVFETCEEAIILEDDCLPHPSFFRFCDELLERYRDDERVMTICGDNYLFGRKRMSHSYFFHHLPGGWGWATWRRAWRHYDVEMKRWPALRETSFLSDILGDRRGVEYWRDTFDRTFSAGEGIDTWDYQWVFAMWAQNGLAATASTNLVTNIGWGPGATHTVSARSLLADIPLGEMKFPLRHPPRVLPDGEADQIIFENIYLPEMSASRLQPTRHLLRMMSRLLKRGRRT